MDQAQDDRGLPVGHYVLQVSIAEGRLNLWHFVFGFQISLPYTLPFMIPSLMANAYMVFTIFHA